MDQKKLKQLKQTLEVMRRLRQIAESMKQPQKMAEIDDEPFSPMSRKGMSKLKRIRLRKGMSLEELAGKMGVSVSYLEQIELGEMNISQEQGETIEAFIRGEL